MDRKHFKCLLWKGLWGLGALSLIGAWIAGPNGNLTGLDGVQLLWNALIFGVLAIPIKLDCHSCDVCNIRS